MPRLGYRLQVISKACDQVILGYRLLLGGFSLVELLVAITIIMLVSAVAIPSLRNFNNAQVVEGSADQLINVFKSGQSSAVNRIKCPTNGEVAGSWQVNLNLSTATDTYALYANCITLGPINVLTNNFSSNVGSGASLKAVTDVCGVSGGQGVNVIIFFINQKVSYQCNGGSQVVGPIKITISDSSGNSKTVVVEAGGIIRNE